MTVFTIYNHGSGGHRDKGDDEIVAFMGRRATGTEYKDYLITDGVGGTPKNKEGRNPLAGTFDVADRNKAPKRGGLRSDDASEKGSKVAARLAGLFSKSASANIQGLGVFDNAQHAIITIANLEPRPKTLNMVGWSRGAITCGVIAHMLYDPATTEGLFRDIEVNIFAIDPVAGGEEGHGENAESRRTISPNVKNYVCVLATGENRNTFAPQDLARLHVTDPTQTHIVFLPFPGKHSTVAKNNDQKSKDISDIVWSMAHQFLHHFGTRQSKPSKLLSRFDFLESYSAVVNKSETLSRIKQKGLMQKVIGQGFGKREMTTQMEKYVVNSEYFVNEHHRAIFALICPELFDWLFTLKHFQPGLRSKAVSPGSAIGSELSRFSPASQFFTSLARLGVSRGAGPTGQGAHYTLPGPAACFDAKGVMNLAVHGDMSRMGLLD